jgi:hypothetical protein
LTDFEKSTQTQKFMKIRPQGAKLLDADGRIDKTDMKKLIVAFRNFAKAPKKIKHSLKF